MNPMDEKNLDTAIALGSAVCKELGICCDQRGRVIFHIYQKLEDLKSEKSNTPTTPTATTATVVATVDGTAGAAPAADMGAAACAAAADIVGSGQAETEKPEN